MADPRLRFRCWVDGVLVDEHVIDVSEPGHIEEGDAALCRHQRLSLDAAERGQSFAVEVVDMGGEVATGGFSFLAAVDGRVRTVSPDGSVDDLPQDRLIDAIRLALAAPHDLA